MREDGPFEMFAKLRLKIGVLCCDADNNSYGESWFAKLFSCIYCISVWLAVPMAVVLACINKANIRQVPLYILAISSAVIIIDELIGKLSR